MPRLVVIGGGAAGFFCAVNAARMDPSLEIIILEKTGKLLSKVRISGGGRCNVTHACYEIPVMQRKYPRGEHFVKKTFHEFFTTDTIDWFSSRGVQLKTEADGRIFPVSDNSETIIGTLLREVSLYGVGIRMNQEVTAIEREHSQWKLSLAEGKELLADFVCIACGGYPKDTAFNWLRGLGHTIIPPVPSLFTFNLPGHAITRLMGLSANVRIKIAGSKMEQSGALLITHWGLSGPAVLTLSARAARDLHEGSYRFSVTINWCPAYNEQEMASQFAELRGSSPTQKIRNRVIPDIPARLWQFLCDEAGVGAETRWADLTLSVQANLARAICGYRADVSGKTTFKEEFVTAGGIRLSEINAATMESRLHPNLYFAGEIIDVDGVTGGFNFQNAWTTGWIAARSITLKRH